jgi:hypothetical protein
MPRVSKRKCSDSYSSNKRQMVMSVPRNRFRSTGYASLTRSTIVDITISNGVPNFSGFSFNSSGVTRNGALNAWGGATDISAGYDAYRLVKVVAEITYNQNSSNVNQSANTLPWVYTAMDYDDAGGAGGINVTAGAITQKDGCRLDNFGTNGGFKVIRSFAPKIALQAYGTSTLSGYMEPKAKQWVSTGTLGSTDPQHYGLWMVVDDNDQTSITICLLLLL